MNRRKAILVLLALLILVSAALIRRESRVIGQISGPEFDRLTIGSSNFLLTDNHGFTSADRGQYLGKAIYHSGISLRLYSVRGDDTGDLIYARWDWEGFWYVRQTDPQSSGAISFRLSRHPYERIWMPEPGEVGRSSGLHNALRKTAVPEAALKTWMQPMSRR